MVNLFDPDYIQTIYDHDEKSPHVTPIMESTKLHRHFRNLSPGMGNVYV